MSFIASFLFAVIFLSFSELYLLLQVASRFSFATAFLLCLFTGLLGGAIVRKQGLSTLAEIGAGLSQGRLPALEIISGLMLLIIGAFLMVPGFITDTLGMLLLIPPLRMKVAARLYRAMEGLIKSGVFKFTSSFSFGLGSGGPSFHGSDQWENVSSPEEEAFQAEFSVADQDDSKEKRLIELPEKSDLPYPGDH